MFHGHSRSAKKRAALRDSLWPESKDKIWPPTNREGGWAKFPRTISLLCRVLQANSKGVDLSGVYIELLSRTPEEGIVAISSEGEHAFLAGFSPNQRGVRSWRERLKLLEELGFIRTFAAPGKDVDQVIILHPRGPMQRLRQEGKISDEHWNLYQRITVDTTGKGLELEAVEKPQEISEAGQQGS